MKVVRNFAALKMDLIMASPKLTKGRASEPGAWYALTMVTADRRPLFLDPGLASIVGDELRSMDPQFAIGQAWVVMPDHVHWLIELGAVASLGNVVGRWKSISAVAVNRAGGLSGSVWQAGFYDHRLRDGEDFRTQAQYMIANPIRAGLVERVDDYPHWWCRWVRRGGDVA